MPSRVIRESIRTSESLAELAAEEERHFYRLLTATDELGRFDARPHVMLGNCYPAMLDRVGIEDVERWTQALVHIEVIELYEVGGKRYGYFRNYDRYNRARGFGKFPAPPSESTTRGESPQVAATGRELPLVAANDSKTRAVKEGRGEVEEEVEIEGEGEGEREGDRGRERKTAPNGAPAPDGAASPSLSYKDIVAIWNEVAEGVLPRVSTITKQRQDKLRTRLKEHRERDSPEWWRRYFQRVRTSAFCRGDNDRGWRADFDWAVRSNDVIARVFEGKYDNTPRAGPGRSRRAPAGVDLRKEHW